MEPVMRHYGSHGRTRSPISTESGFRWCVTPRCNNVLGSGETISCRLHTKKQAPRPDGPPPLCACGCGERVTRKGFKDCRWVKGHTRKYPKGFGDRPSTLKWKYNLDFDLYLAMLARQGGRCAICRDDQPDRGGGCQSDWCVDHDHRNGKVRGLLCRSCNLALGFLRDDPAVCNNAADYLREHEKGSA